MKSCVEIPTPSGVRRRHRSSTPRVVGVWSLLVRGRPILTLGLPISCHQQPLHQRRFVASTKGRRRGLSRQSVVHHHLLSCQCASNPCFPTVASLARSGVVPRGSQLGRESFIRWGAGLPINRGRQPILYSFLRRGRRVRLHWSMSSTTSR